MGLAGGGGVGWGALKAKLILCFVYSRTPLTIFGFIRKRAHLSRKSGLTQHQQKFRNFSGHVSDDRVFLVPATNPVGTKGVNVIKCHFAVWSADMEKLLFSTSPPLWDQ